MTPEQLRASILQQAMEGKLVKQDPNDEPASILLEKITKEKARLIKEKKIKRTKKLPEIMDDEKPFAIPSSWEWVRLGQLFDITSSKRVHKNEWTHAGIPFYRAREIVSLSKNEVFKDPIFISEQTYEDKIKDSGIPALNDILVTGVGTLGVTYVVKDNHRFYFKDGNIIWLKNYFGMNTDFIEKVFMSPLLKNTLRKKRGTTVGTFTIVKANNTVIPFPPLAEQKRIVARLDQLMPLVDEYAEAYDKLKKLDDGFNDKLKQSLLQYAMEGKLVKQDPNDEPASVLLEKIAEEKARLIKEKKIKRTKKLPAITDDEKPFDIPDSWEWVKLGEIGNYIQRGRSPKYDKVNHNHPIISQKCIQWSGITLQDAKFITQEFFEKLENYRFVQKNDILWNSTGTGTVGRANVVREAFEKVPVDSHVTLIRVNRNVDPQFIYYYLISPIIQNNLDEYLTGTTKQKELGLNSILNVVLPIPPINEQKRIVAKLDQLMSTIH